jgi:hypothetical protein
VHDHGSLHDQADRYAADTINALEACFNS